MKRFYVIAGFAVVVLLGSAILHLLRAWDDQETKEAQKYETLNPDEINARFQALQKELLTEVPQTPERYFEVLQEAYRIQGSIKKWERSPGGKGAFADKPGILTFNQVKIDGPEIQNLLSRYSMNLGRFKDTARIESARKAFEASGADPLMQTVPVDYSGVAFSWYLFHLGCLPLVLIHYAIQLRRKQCYVLLEIFGNPLFPIWFFFWEVGVFMYPKKINPMKQLRRAKQFAAMVFCSAVSCIAGTQPRCEKKEATPQHQKYDGPQIHYSFETQTLSGYLGLDGAMFHSAPVQQSDVTISFPCGFYANLWDSEPLGQRSLRPNFGRENDYTLGWGMKAKGFSFDLSPTYFNVFPLSQLPRGDLIQISETIGKPFMRRTTSVEPYLWVREIWPVRGGTPIGGTFVHSGIRYGRTLRGKTISLNPELVYDSGAFGYHEGYIGRFLAGITWKLGRGMSLELPLVRCSTPLSHTDDGRKGEISFGMGLAFAH